MLTGQELSLSVRPVSRRGGRLGRGALGIAVAFVATLALGPGQAWAQTSTPAVVTRVIDGDTIDVLLADGRTVAVRLIGIDTPERGECGTDEATSYMEQLVSGRAINLISDPTQDAVDRFGRSLYYVDRDDGLDVGQEMIRAG